MISNDKNHNIHNSLIEGFPGDSSSTSTTSTTTNCRDGDCTVVQRDCVDGNCQTSRTEDGGVPIREQASPIRQQEVREISDSDSDTSEDCECSEPVFTTIIIFLIKYIIHIYT